MPKTPSPANKIANGPLIVRQKRLTRLTHWSWVIALFFLLLSGLQIFNAHPTLYLGRQSGLGKPPTYFDNSVLTIGAEHTPHGLRGTTRILGHTLDTTGLLGVSGPATDPAVRAFPAWATIPSHRDLATGRVVHFFFAWVLVITLFLWFAGSLFNGHLRADLTPRKKDWRGLFPDIMAHIRGRLSHEKRYSPLQKLTYVAVFFVLFPLQIATGLTLSPGMDTALPFLLDLFGGRQTARTLHFAGMGLLVLFFLVHIVIAFAAGPINELRSILTGKYRIDPGPRNDRKANRT